jgi:hypothetical protein
VLFPPLRNMHRPRSEGQCQPLSVQGTTEKQLTEPLLALGSTATLYTVSQRLINVGGGTTVTQDTGEVNVMCSVWRVAVQDRLQVQQYVSVYSGACVTRPQ